MQDKLIKSYLDSAIQPYLSITECKEMVSVPETLDRETIWRKVYEQLEPQVQKSKSTSGEEIITWKNSDSAKMIQTFKKMDQEKSIQGNKLL